MMTELLERKETLFEMAEIMFGEDFMFEKKFWESSINRDLIEVHDKLDILGWKPEIDITEEVLKAAQALAKSLGFSSDEEDA